MAPIRSLLCLLLVAAPAMWTPAFAQTSTGTSSSATSSSATGSWAGLRSHSYLGLSLGRSNYSVSCPPTSLTCDDSDTAVRLYGGAMLADHWGVEIGYLDMGRIAREGGKTRAQGLNLSLV